MRANVRSLVIHPRHVDVTAVLSRTTWTAATSTPGSTFRRCATKNIRPNITAYGQLLSFTDEMSDATLATQETIYTQAERGAFSGPLQHDAPRSCSYITATEIIVDGGMTAARP